MNTTNHTSPSGEDAANGAIGEREALLADYIELNMSNYGPDDVDRLNAWAIEAYDFISRAALTAEKVAGQDQSWLPVISREFLGRIVREAWVKWAQQQPNPKPSWLAPYDELSEADKEADRQIGEAVTQWVLSIKSATWEVTAEKVAAEPVGYVNGDELDNMLGDRTATIQSNADGWRRTALYRAPQQPAQSAEQDERAATRKVIEPLKEPVHIDKALLGGRNAHVVLSGGAGPMCAVFLVNIQITGWNSNEEWAKGYATGFNQAAAWMQDAILARAKETNNG